jgi:hypothetical protein
MLVGGGLMALAETHCAEATLIPRGAVRAEERLAAFDDRQPLVSSCLVDPAKERWSLWLRHTRLLPWLAWNRMLRGLPHEGRHLQSFAPLVPALGLDDREPSEAELAMAGGGGC